MKCTGFAPNLQRFTVRTWHVGIALLTLLVAQSIVWAPAAGPMLKGLVLAVGLLSYAAPAASLVTVAALTPLGAVMTTRLFEAYPTRMSEALVLACLAGLAMRAPSFSRRADPPVRSAFETWGVVFVAVAVGACLMLMATQQLWQDDVAPFLASVLRFLAVELHDVPGDLRPWERPVGFEYVAVTILLVSGVALAQHARQQCLVNARFPRQLAAAIVVGGGAAALLSLLPDAEGQSLTLARLISPERVAVFTGKVDTAGSFFLLTGMVALGGTGRRGQLAWLTAATLIGTAMWLTGTRAVLVAGGLVAFYIGFVRLRYHGIRPSRLTVSVAALAAVAILALALPHWEVMGPQIATSLRFRWLMSQTALRMMAEEPLFGLGVGQFFLLSERFSSEEMLLMSRTVLAAGRTNAHNYYLQIGAELGLVGLVPFLLLLGAVLLPAATAIRQIANDRLFLGTFAGVTGFLITCAAGQPLILAIVAYPFWLALGLLAALAETAASRKVGGPARAQALASPRAGAAPVIAVTAILLVGYLAGHRVWTDRRAIDMTRVNYGLYDWETDAAGPRFRWTSDSSTVFLDGRAVVASVPLRAVPSLTGPARVRLSLNGRLATELQLTGGDWRTTRLPLPPSGRLHRIDVEVDPVWRPVELLPDSADPRILGVMLGDILTERSLGGS